MIDQSFYKKILIDQKYISKDDAKLADVYESSGKGSFTDYLLQNGIINKLTLGLAIAEHSNTSFTDLSLRTPSADDLTRIPEVDARTYRIVFIKEKDKDIFLATNILEEPKLKEVSSRLFPSKKVIFTFAFKEDIDTYLSHYEKELNTRFSAIIKSEKRVAPEIFEEIIRDAVTYRASDIHFEPQASMTMIRFRIDGLLKLAGSIPRTNYENVLNRIKIQSNLRTDEHFAPQDGAIRFASNDINVDLRVSVVPTLDGEKVVVRILTEYVKGLTFADLGFSERHITIFDDAAKKPFGMILVAGPTGSGKTTTLYSLLKKLNTPEINITTIEDPVEYRMLGATQIQVNQKTDLTFAKGLRAIVRQDPNIILVGEIRDTETAETAVNAALTGHLLLSTFHANDASTCIPRLLDMGVESFLLGSTLELLVAQRLVRRICDLCRYSYVENLSNIASDFPPAKGYFTDKEITLYKGKGCGACNNTGYKGRTCLVEMIEVGSQLKELISSRPSAAEVWKVAKENGARSMFEDGIDKVKIGVSTLEEVFRVAAPNEGIKVSEEKKSRVIKAKLKPIY
ncbi:type II/IV secretion system protein [Arenimonas sp.]|nr:type II/IV secretion system protein [Candidatus Parcubacteria bacterium]